MKPIRRWFQYSLRSFLVLLTASAVWLGVLVNRAREQREAVKAIEALGGGVIYDWELAGEPPASAWVRRIIGDEFLQDVELVIYGDFERAHILRLTQHLQRLRGLKMLVVSNSIDESTLNQLRTSVPECDVCEVGP